AGDLPIDDPGTVTTSPPTTANNYLHVTVSDDNTDNSIQAPNNVLGDDGTGWQVAMATPGALNATQTTGDLSLPVQLALFRAIAGDKQVTLEWVTASEVQNLGFEVWKAVGNRNYELLSSYQSNPDLLGQLNSNSETHYSLIDQMVANGITYHYKLVDVSVNGSRTEHGPVTATPQATEVEVTTIDAEVPMEFELYVNYPNPFNPTTTIRFDIPTLSEMDVVPVALNIYTITGQKVRTLFDGVVEPGVHELVWDGTSDNGRQLSSGVYIAVLTSEQLQKSIRMILSQ
ncbi:MAG: T9SS C-terminal target domain-containing protein, partial [Methanobacteriota archaeon]